MVKQLPKVDSPCPYWDVLLVLDVNGLDIITPIISRFFQVVPIEKKKRVVFLSPNLQQPDRF